MKCSAKTLKHVIVVTNICLSNRPFIAQYQSALRLICPDESETLTIQNIPLETFNNCTTLPMESIEVGNVQSITIALNCMNNFFLPHYGYI